LGTYQKHVLEGALAGVVTGVAVAALLLLLVEPQALEGAVEGVLRWQMERYGVPPSEVEEAVKQVVGVVRASLAIAPLAYVIQYTLLGALFGLLKGFLSTRLKLGSIYAALATGAIYVTLLGAIPLVAVGLLYPELLEVVARYLPNYQLLTLAPAATFTVALVAFSTARGPWTRITEAKPREY